MFEQTPELIKTDHDERLRKARRARLLAQARRQRGD
jgi:hypothetical protein